jgi:putative multiple sugar transport system permease protein
VNGTSTGTNTKKLLQQNIRDYAMYIALAVVIGIFTVMTKGLFLSSRNICNLLNQSGYLAVLAVGMTLVFVIRYFDMSVGYLSGFLGAMAAIGMVTWGWPSWIAILFVLALGCIAGLLMAIPIAKLGVPAFIATLAGWLIYRGALLLVTLQTGTIIIPDKFFIAIGNSSIPDIFPATSAFLPGMHKLTLLLGLAAIIWFTIKAIIDRKNKRAYDFEVIPTSLFAFKLVFMAAIVGAISWIIAGYNGLSWTIIIMLVVVFVYDFVMNRTVLGRHIYAVGGNPEAAELSGISVKKITFIVFGSMGFLTAISGILFASRLQSATTIAGAGLEFDAMSAAYIGGVSAYGGVGKVTSSCVGAIFFMAITSGMNLLGTDIALQYIIKGAVLLIAVIFDVTSRRQAARA